MGQKLTPHQGLIRAQKYCAYQERSHFEVRNKLYEWGLYKSDVENILTSLIQDDFLNEQRFAEAFARGKFRIKQWGRIKIKAELKKRQVTDSCIRKGLNQIEEDEYLESLKTVLQKRIEKEKETNSIKRKQKLASYLNSRGYELDLVWTTLENFED